MEHLTDEEIDKRIDAHTNLDKLMKTVRTLVLMKYRQYDIDQAQRIADFEFVYNHIDDTIPEMVFWLLGSRSKKSKRSINLIEDEIFQNIPPVKELKKVFKHMKESKKTM